MKGGEGGGEFYVNSIQFNWKYGLIGFLIFDIPAVTLQETKAYRCQLSLIHSPPTVPSPFRGAITQ